MNETSVEKRIEALQTRVDELSKGMDDLLREIKELTVYLREQGDQHDRSDFAAP